MCAVQEPERGVVHVSRHDQHRERVREPVPERRDDDNDLAGGRVADVLPEGGERGGALALAGRAHRRALQEPDAPADRDRCAPTLVPALPAPAPAPACAHVRARARARIHMQRTSTRSS